MGLAPSKIRKGITRNAPQEEGSIPSTPILTSKVIQREDVDPRSPTVHFSRTPLQLLSAAALKLDELQETEFTTTSDETPIKPKSVLLGIDPRSPTVEFQRTPIVVSTIDSEASDIIHNKHLDKVMQSTLTTPKSSIKNQKEKIPPKLLGSNSIRVKPDANKRKSFVGLLETNIDFTETDLDTVIREKSKVKQISETSPCHKQLSNVIVKENIDPRSPTTAFVRTPIQIVKKLNDLDLNDEVDFKSDSMSKQSDIPVELQDHHIIEKCVQEICESVHLNAEPETLENEDKDANIDSCKTLQIDDSENEESCNEIKELQDDEIVETGVPLETKSAPITPPIAVAAVSAVEKETKSAPVTPPVVNLTADVKEFDKKLTNLIYHDEDIVICPRKVKLKDYDSRSPLRSLNRNESDKNKSGQKSKAHNTMKKSEYVVSKIPVFKEKHKTDIQCENTPPRNMEKRKTRVRKSRWDNADATLII